MLQPSPSHDTSSLSPPGSRFGLVGETNARCCLDVSQQLLSSIRRLILIGIPIRAEGRNWPSRGKEKSLSSKIDSVGGDKKSKASKGDFEKNLAIAFVANSIRTAVDHAESENWQKSRKTLQKSFEKAKNLFSDHDDDEDFQRVAKIADKMLKRFNELSDDDDDRIRKVNNDR